MSYVPEGQFQQLQTQNQSALKRTRLWYKLQTSWLGKRFWYLATCYCVT